MEGHKADIFLKLDRKNREILKLFVKDTTEYQIIVTSIQLWIIISWSRPSLKKTKNKSKNGK